MRTRQWLVPAVIAAQVTVPLVALLGSEPPTRLGFQMYSGLGRVDITVDDRQGEEIDSAWRDVLPGNPRPELEWTDTLPEALCAIPGAARVTVSQLKASRTVSRTVQC